MLKCPDLRYLECYISEETGLAFESRTGTDVDGQRWFSLRPSDMPEDQTFAICTTLGWRRLQIEFVPGKFAAELLADMSNADATGRAAFGAILSDCRDRGAEINLEVNGDPFDFNQGTIWEEGWTRFALSLNKGQVELGADGGELDTDIVCQWTGRFAAAVIAILPIEDETESNEDESTRFPEGAVTTVLTNRYERDRRNRAAAISIHGVSCRACGFNMGEQYGEVASGFIEIHHVTPISELGPGYVVDPVRDLVPLCPNCHAVVHRRTPPFSVAELRQILK